MLLFSPLYSVMRMYWKTLIAGVYRQETVQQIFLVTASYWAKKNNRVGVFIQVQMHLNIADNLKETLTYELLSEILSIVQ